MADNITAQPKHSSQAVPLSNLFCYVFGPTLPNKKGNQLTLIQITSAINKRKISNLNIQAVFYTMVKIMLS